MQNPHPQANCFSIVLTRPKEHSLISDAHYDSLHLAFMIKLEEKLLEFNPLNYLLVAEYAQHRGAHYQGIAWFDLKEEKQHHFSNTLRTHLKQLYEDDVQKPVSVTIARKPYRLYRYCWKTKRDKYLITDIPKEQLALVKPWVTKEEYQLNQLDELISELTEYQYANGGPAIEHNLWIDKLMDLYYKYYKKFPTKTQVTTIAIRSDYITKEHYIELIRCNKRDFFSDNQGNHIPNYNSYLTNQNNSTMPSDNQFEAFMHTSDGEKFHNYMVNMMDNS